MTSACVHAWAPGRVELAGNHTDHQGGRVIAATVDCGIDMDVCATGTSAVRMESEGFPLVEMTCDDAAVRVDEMLSTAGLVRGVITGLRAAGVAVGGFSAHASSTVPAGSGLSSSAAFEMALARALVELFATEPLDSVTLARIGQAAERDYFGKPCGLMDQLSIALGGIVALDFGAGDDVGIESLSFDFEQAGYALCLIDTHCDHSAYTSEYAQVARDMDTVATFMGAPMLSQVDKGAFTSALAQVRHVLGDRAALRALHYFNEMRLVDERERALRAGDIEAFLAMTRASGASSAAYLQNVSTFDAHTQPAMVALALADVLLEGEGACRIHGGGFGGTVQAFVPLERLGGFTNAIDEQLGAGSCKRYSIVNEGACVK